MANGIKIGNDTVNFKVGSADCKVYLGDTLLYPSTPPTPTLQWVTFNNGDSVDGLQAYGIKGTVSDLVEVFGNYYGRDITFGGGCIGICDYCLQIGDGPEGCYQQCLSASDNVEVIFSNVGCSDYYTLSDTRPVGSNPIQLYIYA